MTSDARSASKGITSEDTPTCWLDWRIHNCHPFLRLFDKELELRHPKLYAFIHKGWILRPPRTVRHSGGSGRFRCAMI